MTDLRIDIFNNSTNFLLKYLAKKKNRTATFDKHILKLNHIETDLKSFVDDCSMILQMDGYVTIIYSNDTSFKFQLTQQGYDFAKFISYDTEIFFPTFISRVTYYILNFFKYILFLITSLIALIIEIVWTNKTNKAITLICTIIGGVAGGIEIYKWLKKL